MSDKNKIDIVYYYKNTFTDELKYSIRSACKNLKVGNIYLVGDKPKWFKESYRCIYVKSHGVNIERYGLGSVPIQHLKVLSKNIRKPNNFLLFNDDFFILKKIDEWIDYHRDEEDYKEKAEKNTTYHLRTLESLNITRGDRKFNLHSPMRINMDNFLNIYEVWKKLPNKDIDFRTLYGNSYIEKSIPIKDSKLQYAVPENIDDLIFCSTSDICFGKSELANYLREKFKEPSFAEMIK